MNKSIAFITVSVVIIALLLGMLSFVYFQPSVPFESSKSSSTQSKEQNSTSSTVFVNESSVNNNLPSKISQSMLSEHNTAEDCWVGYNGKAYDITSFLPNHKGGVSAIARNCGTSTQFEDAFKKQHGTSKASLFIKVAIYKGDLE